MAAAGPVEAGRNTLVRGSAVVMAGFVLSRVLGLAREVVVGGLFGTSAAYDAYQAAFRLPDLLFLLVMSGAFGSAFLPVFVGLWSRGDRAKAWRLANAVLTLATLACLVAVGVAYLAAPWLMTTVVAPGLAAETREIATQLTRLLLLSPLLLGLGAAAMGILNARSSFFWPAFAPVAYNLGIIGGALWLGPSHGVYGLAVGVVVGAGGHFAWQLPGLWRVGLRYRPVLWRQVEGLAVVSRLFWPRLLSQAVFQLNFIVLTNVGSYLAPGRLAALSYAYLLAMLPHGVFALSLATVIFPALAEGHERGGRAALRAPLDQALRLLLFLTLPAAGGLVVLRQPIVQLLFQWREFTPESTRLVSETLAWFALGLVAVALAEALSRAFYAMHDTVTPLVAGLAALVTMVAASLALSGPLQHAGLALAMSLAAVVELGVLWLVIWRRVGGWPRASLTSLWRAAVATAAMVGVLWLLGGDPDGGRDLAAVLGLGLRVAVGLAVYLGVGLALGMEEPRWLWRAVRGRGRHG